MSCHSERLEDTTLKSRITVDKPGAPPPCLETGRILCRGCPGWTVMHQALLDPDSGWTTIHCSATGLIIRRLT